MITKAALLLFRDNDGIQELLFVRAKGKPYFVFPGGKQEQGETIEAALQRELQEELGVQASATKKLGVVSGKTPDGRDIEMHLYLGELYGAPKPQSEIEQSCWLSKSNIQDHADAMTPMTLLHVLPLLDERGVW